MKILIGVNQIILVQDIQKMKEINLRNYIKVVYPQLMKKN